MDSATWRHLKAAFSNAVIWGVVSALGWTGLSLVFFLLAQLDPEVTRQIPLRVIPRLAAITGSIGFVTGGAFSGLVRFLSRARSIEDFGVLETALWGGLAGVVGYAPFLADDLLKGALPTELIPASLVGAGAVGAVTSYGVLRIGRRDPDRVARVDDTRPRVSSGPSDPGAASAAGGREPV